MIERRLTSESCGARCHFTEERYLIGLDVVILMAMDLAQAIGRREFQNHFLKQRMTLAFGE
jgi:hypothetical protein